MYTNSRSYLYRPKILVDLVTITSYIFRKRFTHDRRYFWSHKFDKWRLFSILQTSQRSATNMSWVTFGEMEHALNIFGLMQCRGRLKQDASNTLCIFWWFILIHESMLSYLTCFTCHFPFVLFSSYTSPSLAFPARSLIQCLPHTNLWTKRNLQTPLKVRKCFPKGVPVESIYCSAKSGMERSRA